MTGPSSRLQRGTRVRLTAALASVVSWLLLGLLAPAASATVPAAAPTVPSASVGLPAAGGVSPAVRPSRTVTYEVRTRGTVASDVGTFRREASRILTDRRGWSLGGSVRFTEVGSGGDLTLWLASPSAVAGFSPGCSPNWSCRVGRDVIINDRRWRNGTSTWPDVREYRSYVVNHEMGHWLGLGHPSCPRAGAPAPVMQQQSISLEGCRSNTWPTESERQSAGRQLGVPVRSKRPDLHAITQTGGTGTEVHVLDGAQAYRSFSLHTATPLSRTSPSRWWFLVADRDRDGVDDVWAVTGAGASGRTEVHVLDGASGYRQWQLHATTPLHHTSTDDWSFDTGDVDGDGVLDLLALAHAGASGTEVHVLDGADDFRSWQRHAATPLHGTDPDRWSLRVGDHDRDGRPDLYAIDRSGGSGRTDVHVLDGASGWSRFSAHTVSGLGRVGADWELLVDDMDGDGRSDVVAVARAGGSGQTEVHALAGPGYRSFVLHAATALHRTDSAPGWRFAVD